MKKQPNVEIYRDSKREWRARLKAANGEIVATSEGFKRKQDAVKWPERLIAALFHNVAIKALS